jgi:hypothetical protein
MRVMKPDYYIAEDYIRIYSSYLVPKRDFRSVLEEICDDNPQCPVVQNRSVCDMSLEWAVHNFVYDLGFNREETKDADLNWPRKNWEKIVYNVLGVLVWPWIR